MCWLISKPVSAQQAWSEDLAGETGVTAQFTKGIPGSWMVCKKVWWRLRARLTSLTAGQSKGQVGIKHISSKKGNKQRVELGPMEAVREAVGALMGETLSRQQQGTCGEGWEWRGRCQVRNQMKAQWRGQKWQVRSFFVCWKGSAGSVPPRGCPAKAALLMMEVWYRRTTCSSPVMATQSTLFSEGGSDILLPNLPAPLLSFPHCRADSLSGARCWSGYCRHPHLLG